ncbi:phage holin [Bifidobacterium moukalabense]|uniref:phage holin n=1 Tax=Bifidobacterium moukalabense TaxID=1333651 RepID=UPI0010F721E5|nr:phage holin [Bifidobacterium moukalabense]
MADHATKTNNNLPGMTTERVKAIVTIVVTLYALLNAGLNLAGINTLPFTNDQVSATLFAVIGVIGTVYGWWKNQNITSASLAGQQLVDALKKEGVVNGVTAAKNAALSAASAVAKTAPAAETAEDETETVEAETETTEAAEATETATETATVETTDEAEYEPGGAL